MTVQSDLEAYASLLRKWNAVQNLVSRETVGELWPRHIEDSLQLLDLLRPTDRRFIDLGSGGGFPAIPLAIASRETQRHFTLVEPIAKKAAFLRTVIRELGLNATVLAMRAEQIDSRETFDCVTSRALASMPELLRLSLGLIDQTTHLLLHKGKNFPSEVSAATALFSFDMLAHPSKSDPEGVILEITNLRENSAA